LSAIEFILLVFLDSKRGIIPKHCCACLFDDVTWECSYFEPHSLIRKLSFRVL